MSEPTHSRTLSVLIPLYNERPYVRRLIQKVLAAPLPTGFRRELVVVDDASTDGGADIVRELAAVHPEIRLFSQEVNRGKGAAIRRAVEEMTGDYAIIQDADLEYDPNDYEQMLAPVLAGWADVVYGSRFTPRHMRKVLNYHHTLGNTFLTHLSNLLTGLNLTDMETCYKLFAADLLRTIPIRSDRFGVEPELTAKIAKRNAKIYEVPISYHGRSYLEGKKIGLKDAFAAFYTIVKYWLVDDCYEARYGQEFLSDISHGRRFNRWMFDELAPYLGSRIVEVGSGIGNISRLLPVRELLTVTDYDPEYVKLLESAFGDHEAMTVAPLDLTSDADVDALAPNGYDTVVCLNVLEHIEDDRGALMRMRRLLAPGGCLVLLVPQYQWLHSSFDEMLGHYRRYDRAGLETLARETGFAVEGGWGFNVTSLAGWWLNSKVLRRERIGKAQMKLFDMLVPILRIVERPVRRTGLSMIMILRREG